VRRYGASLCIDPSVCDDLAALPTTEEARVGDRVELRTGEVIFARPTDAAGSAWFPAAVNVTAGVGAADTCMVVTREGEICELRRYARRNPQLQLGSNPRTVLDVGPLRAAVGSDPADLVGESIGASRLAPILAAAAHTGPTPMRPIRFGCCTPPHRPIHQCRCGC
jgi:hypothetical protein